MNINKVLVDEVDYNGVSLMIEYTIAKSAYKPYKNYYQPQSVKVPNCDIDISEVIGESCWIGIEDELRKINENNT